jgi:hypothetical protein
LLLLFSSPSHPLARAPCYGSGVLSSVPSARIGFALLLDLRQHDSQNDMTVLPRHRYANVTHSPGAEPGRAEPSKGALPPDFTYPLRARWGARAQSPASSSRSVGPRVSHLLGRSELQLQWTDSAPVTWLTGHSRQQLYRVSHEASPAVTVKSRVALPEALYY